MRHGHMRTCISIKGGVCDSYEIQGNFRNFQEVLVNQINDLI